MNSADSQENPWLAEIIHESKRSICHIEEAWAGLVSEALDEGIVVLDDANNIHTFNRRVLDILGLPDVSPMPSLSLLSKTSAKSSLRLGSVLLKVDSEKDEKAQHVSVLKYLQQDKPRLLEGEIQAGDQTKMVQLDRRHFTLDGKAFKFLVIKETSAIWCAREQEHRTNRMIVQLAQIAHDLKSPLRCIQSSSSLIQSLIAESPEVQTLGRNIHTNFEFIFSMIEDVQDLAKLTTCTTLSLTIDHFSLRDLVASIQTMFQLQFESKKIRLVIEVGSEIPAKILADSKRLKQLLLNLVGNSFKFTTNGHVKISIGMPEIIHS